MPASWAKALAPTIALFTCTWRPVIPLTRRLVGTIRSEAESVVGTSRELRERILKAADAAQTRLADLDALFEVVQEEVESTVLDAAASVRMVRRGLSLVDWGRRALKRGRKH